MKLQIISDTHLEHAANKFPPISADVCLFAGDISHSEQFKLKIVELCQRYKQVYYVPGNHDYFNSSLSEINTYLSSSVPTNLTYLHPGVVTPIAGRQVIGCTLWFAAEKDPQKLELIKKDMSDLKYIHGVTYEQLVKLGKTEKQWLDDHITPGCIVLTHHLPSFKSIEGKWQTYFKNSTYVNDCEELIITKKPAVWIHGHTHTPFSYQLGETNIYCHPSGYPEQNRELAPFVIDI